jgi:hypothetical protein
MCLGELFLHCGAHSSRHLKRVLDLLLLSCEGVLTLHDLNYAEALQEAIVETLMCLFHGVEQTEGRKLLGQSLGFIIEFVKLTTEHTRSPPLAYVQECMMLLADVSSILPNQVGQLAKCTFVADRVASLARYNKDGHLTQCIAYVRQQFRLTP